VESIYETLTTLRSIGDFRITGRSGCHPQSRVIRVDVRARPLPFPGGCR
jgi:hypothetical protein